MKLHVIVVESIFHSFTTLHTYLEDFPEVAHIYTTTTLQEVENVRLTHQIDLLFIHPSFLEGLESLSLPTFIVVGKTRDIQQSRIAYRAGARGYLPENVTKEGLRFILQQLAQGKGPAFFLDADTICELLSEATNTPIPVTDISSLSSREQKIVYLLHSGLRNKDIEEQLGISEATVRTHIANIKRKLNVTRYQIPSLRLPERPTNSPPPRVTGKNGRNDFWHLEKIIGLLMVFWEFSGYASNSRCIDHRRHLSIQRFLASHKFIK